LALKFSDGDIFISTKYDTFSDHIDLFKKRPRQNSAAVGSALLNKNVPHFDVIFFTDSKNTSCTINVG
jgi:hypothetical protein